MRLLPFVPDFREIENAGNEGNERAKIALDSFQYAIASYIAKYAVAMNGVDYIIFTGGIGENQINIRKGICKEEVRMYSSLWNDLVEDNSPLRAVVNGKVLGVPEDFYDFQIWKRLTKKPVKEARLIGDILGYSQISIGDWWYAKRIEHYIQHKKICVVEDSVNKYARMICLIKD